MLANFVNINRPNVYTLSCKRTIIKDAQINTSYSSKPNSGANVLLPPNDV